MDSMELPTGKILIVDDDIETERLVNFYLKNKAYFIIAAKNEPEVIYKTRHFPPDIILLDISAVKWFPSETIRQLLPGVIVMLMCNELEYYKIQGLNIAVYDYIPKPLKQEVLISKISLALDFGPKINEPDEKLVFGPLEINISNFVVYYNNQKIVLAKKEFELLALLATKPGRVFLRHEILQRIWGIDSAVGSRTIDVHVRKIRSKLGVDVIATVKRVGYKFQL
jgi:two-component system alkaline phosphatase synthesis response regulator PhoP